LTAAQTIGKDEVEMGSVMIARAAVSAAFLAVTGAASAAGLTAEARKVKDAYVANISAVATLSAEYRMSLSRPGATETSQSRFHPPSEAVTWDRKSGRLKRERRGPVFPPKVSKRPARAVQTREPEPPPPADPVMAKTPAVQTPAANTPAANTPAPAWLWLPELLMPGEPSASREDGEFLVLVFPLGKGAREVWFSRTEPIVGKFRDLAPSGEETRFVSLTGWNQVSGIWLPKVIEDGPASGRPGTRKVLAFIRVSLNLPVTEADFRAD